MTRQMRRRVSMRSCVCGAAVLLAIMAGPALAASSAAYTVGNYPVEAQARDAVAAKSLAIAAGQDAAFRSLLRRLVPVTAYKRLKQRPAVKSADFIEGVSVKKERNSPTEYIATLDFAFDQASVRNYLNRAGIPYVDEQAAPVMLIPLWRDSAGGPLQGGRGVWFEAWSGLDLTHALAPLRLEGLKPEIGPDALKAVIDNGGATGRTFASAYRTDNVLIALAEPDSTGTKLLVTLAGQDAAGPFVLKRAYRISGGDRGYAAELAAVIGLGVLEGRWKAAKAGAIGGVDVASSDGAIPLTVEFSSLAEWNDLRSRLLDTDGAYDLDIGAVTARSAAVTVRHAGGPDGLNAALVRAGLSMQLAGSAWLVRPTF